MRLIPVCRPGPLSMSTEPWALARDVDAELTSVATIEPVSQAPVAFPAGGTVATVDVAVGVGDTVAVGQELASLDTAQLARERSISRRKRSPRPNSP